jgi:hypothetical protein
MEPECRNPGSRVEGNLEEEGAGGKGDPAHARSEGLDGGADHKDTKGALSFGQRGR